MTTNQCLKRYFWELNTFTKCSSASFKEMKEDSTTNLYLYKHGHPCIIVKLNSPTQKKQGWIFSKVQILQKMNDNPKISHWRSLIFPFSCEILLTQLQKFRQKLNQQIESLTAKKTKEVERWMKQEIDDVLVVASKGKESAGNEYLFQIKSLVRDRYINYFQMHRWNANAWQGLLQIAKTHAIENTCSFGDLFEEISSFINSFQVIKEQKYSIFDSRSSWKENRRKLSKDDKQKSRERIVLHKNSLQQYIKR